MRLNDTSFHVAGVPVPQGSKKAFRHSKTGRVVVLDDNDRLAYWRELVTVTARAAWAGAPPATGVVKLRLFFYLPRPASHYGTGRNAGRVKDSAPDWPAVKPDLDKLVRAVFDSLTVAGVWKDDAVCVGLEAYKAYAGGPGQWSGVPGVVVRVDSTGGVQGVD